VPTKRSATPPDGGVASIEKDRVPRKRSQPRLWSRLRLRFRRRSRRQRTPFSELPRSWRRAVIALAVAAPLSALVLIATVASHVGSLIHVMVG
jgi:hypothetical protein